MSIAFAKEIEGNLVLSEKIAWVSRFPSHSYVFVFEFSNLL